MAAPIKPVPPPKIVPQTAGVSFHYNPPGFLQGPKELSVSLQKVGDGLRVVSARITKGIPSDIFGTPARRMEAGHLDPASPAYNPKLAGAADALAGAMSVLIPEIRAEYPPQDKPGVDTGIGWGNKTYNIGITADGANAVVNVWGTYKKHPAPMVGQAVEALTSFGQILWKEGFHRF